MQEFVWDVRVYWEDTDAGGVVYHGRYVAFMERARSEWLRANGTDQVQLKHEQGLGFVVRAMELEFLAPARLDDELEVSVSVQSHKRVSVSFDQHVRRKQDGKILCRGHVHVACINFARMRPAAIPEQLLARM